MVGISGSSKRHGYTYDEVKKYQTDCHLRNTLIGSTIGSTLYLLLVLFVILSESHERFDVFRSNRLMPTYLTILTFVVLVNFALRYLVASYLNAYLVFLFYCLILFHAIFGNFEYKCDTIIEPIPLTGYGHIPLFLIGSFERIFDLKPDKLNAELYSLRCDQSLVRLGSVNLLAEVINVGISFRLIFVQ